MPSSTSSSDAAPTAVTAALVRFGRHLLWLVPLLFLAMSAFNIVTVRLGYSALPQLANIGLQKAKLETVERLDTVFLGDSSLGRMLDIEAWQTLSGETALSLALTGGEGYVGDLYMLQQVLKRHRPRRVVLVHTTDMLTRNIAWEAYFVVRPHAPSVAPPPKRFVREQLEVYASKDLLLASLQGIVSRLLDRPLPYVDDGYVRGQPALVQRRQFDIEAPEVFEVDDIDPEKFLFLDLVIELCARERLECHYAFGPIWDEICERSGPYLATVRALIEARGLPVVDGTPLCTPLAHLDDTEDHIVRARMPEYTAAFFAKLEGHERQEGKLAAAP